MQVLDSCCVILKCVGIKIRFVSLELDVFASCKRGLPVGRKYFYVVCLTYPGLWKTVISSCSCGNCCYSFMSGLCTVIICRANKSLIWFAGTCKTCHQSQVEPDNKYISEKIISVALQHLLAFFLKNPLICYYFCTMFFSNACKRPSINCWKGIYSYVSVSFNLTEK